MNEEWRDIPGFPGYQASSEGGIRSKKSYGWFVLHPHKLYGRPRIRCFRKQYYVHRLVGLAFCPNPEGKPFINHIDGDKANNRAENLEWCTQKENNRHAYATGLKFMMTGEKNPNAKLTDAQVAEIRASKETAAWLSAKYGVSQNHIYLITQHKARA